MGATLKREAEKTGCAEAITGEGLKKIAAGNGTGIPLFSQKVTALPTD